MNAGVSIWVFEYLRIPNRGPCPSVPLVFVINEKCIGFIVCFQIWTKQFYKNLIIILLYLSMVMYDGENGVSQFTCGFINLFEYLKFYKQPCYHREFCSYHLIAIVNIVEDFILKFEREDVHKLRDPTGAI